VKKFLVHEAEFYPTLTITYVPGFPPTLYLSATDTQEAETINLGDVHYSSQELVDLMAYKGVERVVPQEVVPKEPEELFHPAQGDVGQAPHVDL